MPRLHNDVYYASINNALLHYVRARCQSLGGRVKHINGFYKDMYINSGGRWEADSHWVEWIFYYLYLNTAKQQEKKFKYVVKKNVQEFGDFILV